LQSSTKLTQIYISKFVKQKKTFFFEKQNKEFFGFLNFSFCVLALVSLILVLFFSFLRGKRVKKNKQKKAKTKKKKKTKAIRTLNIVFLKKEKFVL